MEQNSLFDNLNEFNKWKDEWQDMPEFEMGNTEPFQKIIVSFKSKEDVNDFAKLINQKITYKTKSLWFPKDENYIAPKNFVYKNEE